MAGGAAPGGGGGGGGGSQKNYKKRHPDSSYETKYPYNRVMVTESGHEFHWDDTKGNERVRLAHMSGSYMELSPNGRRVEMTVGPRVEYNKGGVTETTDRNWDTKLKGSRRKSISGDQHEEVLGTCSSAVDKDRKQTTGGDHVTATKGDSTHGIVGNYTHYTGGGTKFKSDKGMQFKTTGDASMESSGKKLIYSQGDMTLKSDGNMQITAQKITMTASTIILESGDIRLGSAGASRKLALQDSLTESLDPVVQDLAGSVKGE